MRDRHGTTLLDLLAEARNNRAIRPEHIAKSCGHETCRTLDLTLGNSQTEALDIDLGQALRRTHNIGRVDRLIGRDHHHLLGTIFHCQIGHIARTEHIGHHRLAGILLHQRHVLISRCVEHHRGAEITENHIHTLANAHIANYGHKLQLGETCLQLQANVVHRGLCRIEQNQSLDIERCDLAAQLATDRAGSSRHQHRLALQCRNDLGHIDIDLGTTQQILDLDLADHLAHNLAIDHLIDGRSHQHLDTQRLAIADQSVLLAMSAIAGREQYSIDRQAGRYTLQILRILKVVNLLLAHAIRTQLRAIGQATHNTIVCRILQSHNHRNRLIINSIDQNILHSAAGRNTRFKRIVEDQHHHSQHHECRQRQNHIDRHIEPSVLAKIGHHAHHKAQIGHQKQLLDHTRSRKTTHLFEGRIANNNFVGSLHQKRHNACHNSHTRRQHQHTRRHNGRGQVRNRQKSDQRRRHRYKRINQQYNPIVEISIEADSLQPTIFRSHNSLLYQHKIFNGQPQRHTHPIYQNTNIRKYS